MDVPVIICDKLQQVFVEYVEVPQLQFIDSMVVFQLLHRDRYAQCKLCSWCQILQVQFLGVVDMPVVVLDNCMIQTVQKTAESQLGWLPCPSSCNDRCRFWSRQC